MRLFVAVWPPAGVVDVLAALDRPALDGVRWTGPSQWHVTLRFLGEVPDALVGEVVDALGTCAGRLTPASVVVGERTARFGRRVLHVPVAGLRTWAEEVSAATAPFGAASDGRAFVGHLTLARGPLPAAGAPLPEGPRSWTATSFDLVRSRLGRGPAAYETVASFVVGDHPPHERAFAITLM